MHLMYDEYEDHYVWIEELADGEAWEELSPRYDDAEAALAWLEKITEIIKNADI